MLGNFINRVTRFTVSRFGGRVPGGDPLGSFEEALVGELNQRIDTLTKCHEEKDLRKAASETRAIAIWVLGNEYLHTVAPWSAVKTDPKAAATSVRVALNLCVLFATIAAPFIPDAAASILQAFGIESAPRWPDQHASILDQLTVGSKVDSPPLLFRKIEDAEVVLWTERFGSGENSRDVSLLT